MPTSATTIDAGTLPLPDKPLSGYADVVSYLRREITLGRLRTGDRLPSERRLSEHLGVARETLRQALRLLEGSGLIVVQRGSRGGSFVQNVPVEPEEALRRIILHRTEILDVIECRSLVETGAARLAALRRTDESLAELEAAQNELENAETLHESRDSDTAFHLAIARACGNREVLQTVENLRVKMFHMVDVINYEFIRDSSHSAHERILNAIREGDADRAAIEMELHLDTTREELDHILQAHSV